MNYSIETTSFFSKQLKRLVKKYPSLKVEFQSLITALSNNPTLGTPLGNHCYKIRLQITSKGKGKSGGARVLTYVHVINSKIYLLSIYDKAEQSNIQEKDLLAMLKQLQ